MLSIERRLLTLSTYIDLPASFLWIATLLEAHLVEILFLTLEIKLNWSSDGLERLTILFELLHPLGGHGLGCVNAIDFDATRGR
jgi:hypothetical protein